LRREGCEGSLLAIQFNAAPTAPPARLRAVYQLDVDEWNGRERLQLIVRHLEPA
jgi:single-stranded-DNA-specific exonuclease